MRRYYILALAVLLVGVSVGAQQQQKPPSLGDAARRAREQKKDAPKAKKEFTNDNLRTTPGAVSAVGPTAGEPSAEGATGPVAGSGQEAERTEADSALRSERAKLEAARKQLELARREYDLQRAQYYSNPQYASDAAGKARLDELAAQQEAAAAAATEAEQKVAALEEKVEGLNRSLGPKKQEPLTPEQQQEEFAKRLRPLREELARVEAELQRMRTEAVAQGSSLYGTTQGGSLAANRLSTLERRRSELQQQIAAIEDEARRAGVSLPPAPQ